MLKLEAGPELQEALDALSTTHPGLKSLVVESPGFFDSELRASFEVNLPKLEELQLADDFWTKINLTPELTPNLTKLRFQNVLDETELTVRSGEVVGARRCPCHQLRLMKRGLLQTCSVACAILMSGYARPRKLVFRQSNRLRDSRYRSVLAQRWCLGASLTARVSS